MIKKISAMLIALTLTTTALASCGVGKPKNSSSSSKSSSSASSSAKDTTSSAAETPAEPSLTIDGKAVKDLDKYIVCTVDGRDVDFATFRYYYFYTISQYASTYGVSLDDITAKEDGFQMLLSDTITAIKQEYVAPQLAEENDIALDDSDQKSIDDNIDKAKANYDDDAAFEEALKSAYLNDDLYRTMLESAQLYTKVTETLFSNGGKYATSEEDFKKIIADTSKYSREVHIMIPFYSQVELDDSTTESYDDLTLAQKASAKQSAYSALDDDAKKKADEAAKKTADEVLQKVKDGEDFDKLIKDYGWDTGLDGNTDGYYINKDNSSGYPENLVTEAFKLKEDETSTELVTDDDYGYFIVKRLPVDMDYVTTNISDMIAAYDSPAISKLYQERMDKMTVTYCDDWDKITADSIT